MGHSHPTPTGSISNTETMASTAGHTSDKPSKERIPSATGLRNAKAPPSTSKNKVVGASI